MNLTNTRHDGHKLHRKFGHNFKLTSQSTWTHSEVWSLGGGGGGWGEGVLSDTFPWFICQVRDLKQASKYNVSPTDFVLLWANEISWFWLTCSHQLLSINHSLKEDSESDSGVNLDHRIFFFFTAVVKGTSDCKTQTRCLGFMRSIICTACEGKFFLFFFCDDFTAACCLSWKMEVTSPPGIWCL